MAAINICMFCEAKVTAFKVFVYTLEAIVKLKKEKHINTILNVFKQDSHMLKQQFIPKMDISQPNISHSFVPWSSTVVYLLSVDY